MSRPDSCFETQHGTLFYKLKVADKLKQENVSGMGGGYWSHVMRGKPPQQNDKFAYVALEPLIVCTIMHYGCSYSIVSIRAPMFAYSEESSHSAYDTRHEFRTYNPIKNGENHVIKPVSKEKKRYGQL